MIKRVLPAALVLTAVLAPVVPAAAATPLVAAQGTFGFTAPDGQPGELTDPADFTCFTIEITAANNGTDRNAVLYADENCEGESRTLPAGESGSGLTVKSVRFVSCP
ncbi:hypothetical protein [Actinomadura terrae]|uniref:hypothetical protein n=1 Tax=Actinomadura terrae TaxID=604353 RepID=UPI001FA70945|nr:hypothetical protein [Actinomadura terrae]